MKYPLLSCFFLVLTAIAGLSFAWKMYRDNNQAQKDGLIESFNKFVESQDPNNDTFIYLVKNNNDAGRYQVYEMSSQKHKDTNALVVSRKQLVFQDGKVRAVGEKKPEKGFLFANTDKWYNKEQLNDLRRDLSAEFDNIVEQTGQNQNVDTVRLYYPSGFL